VLESGELFCFYSVFRDLFSEILFYSREILFFIFGKFYSILGKFEFLHLEKS